MSTRLSTKAPIGPDLNHDDFLALGTRTTSNALTRKKVADLLADAKYQDNWALAIWPGITTTKIDVWKVGGIHPAFTVIFAPDTPIEVYDGGRRRGTRVTVKNAAERVAKGWWRR